MKLVNLRRKLAVLRFGFVHAFEIETVLERRCGLKHECTRVTFRAGYKLFWSADCGRAGKVFAVVAAVVCLTGFSKIGIECYVRNICTGGFVCAELYAFLNEDCFVLKYAPDYLFSP